MTTYIVAWGENGRGASPLGTVPSVEAGQEWCQATANQYAEDVLPLFEWKHFLSRGDGPGTSHYVAQPSEFPGETYEVWCIGELT